MKPVTVAYLVIKVDACHIQLSDEFIFQQDNSVEHNARKFSDITISYGCLWL